MSDYPRDMIGYGRNPPRVEWPGNARIALQFVLNYEEGGENCILHGDDASEAFLSEIVGAQPLAGVRHMNMESTYEYGARVGVWRLLRLFERKEIPLTVFAVAMAAERNPEVIRAMVSAGHEIASHGENGQRNFFSFEQAQKPPHADPGTIFVNRFGAHLADAWERGCANNFGQKGLGRIVPMQDAILAAFLIIEDEL